MAKTFPTSCGATNLLIMDLHRVVAQKAVAENTMPT